MGPDVCVYVCVCVCVCVTQEQFSVAISYFLKLHGVFFEKFMLCGNSGAYSCLRVNPDTSVLHLV